MANNCLVTKLKGVVDNDNLLEFGEIILTTTTVGTTGKFVIDTRNFKGVIITKKIITPGYSFTNSEGVVIGTETTEDAVYLPKETPKGVKVSLKSKYNIPLLATNGYCYDISNAFFRDDMTLFSYNEEWVNPPYEPGLIGKLSDFIRYSNINTIDIKNGHFFVSDIESFGELPLCNYANVLLNNVIVGDLVNIVKKRVSKFNQLTGDIYMGLLNYASPDARNMMFGGNAVVGDHTNSHLTWSTEGTTVTVNYTSSDKPTLTTTFEIS